MSAYHDLDDFLIEVFPQEFEIRMKRKKSEIEQFQEAQETQFEKDLKEIIEGKTE
jgi:hypothetical protein